MNTDPKLVGWLNKVRRGAQTLDSYAPAIDYYEGIPQDRLRDVLCDVMHACDAMGIDFNDGLASAREHYDEERDEKTLALFRRLASSEDDRPDRPALIEAKSALAVLVGTPHIKAHLMEADPMALRQAMDAIATLNRTLHQPTEETR